MYVLVSFFITDPSDPEARRLFADDRVVQIFKYNTLEAVYLITSMFVLLSGMAFQSAVLEPGSDGYTFLAVMVRLDYASRLPLWARSRCAENTNFVNSFADVRMWCR